MRPKGRQRHLLGVVWLCLTFSAPAQELKGIAIGQLKLIPTLGLSIGYDGNLARVDSSVQESYNTADGGYFILVSPGIRLEAPTDKSLFSLAWEKDYKRHKDSSTNDTSDWNLRAKWDWEPTPRTDIGLFASWTDGHVERGEGTRQGDLALLPLEQDQYESRSWGASWTYGALGSRGRLSLSYSETELDYTNNPEYTEMQDRESNMFGATLFVRVRPKTSALVGVRYENFDYTLDSFSLNPTVSTLDGDSRYLFVGVTWDVSARTNGRIDYGWHQKNFDAPDRSPYDSNFWRASVDWSPRTYSTFVLQYTRDTRETIGYGDYILRDEVSLAWRHSWAPRFSTTVEYGIGTDDPEPSPRKDDYTTWGISARWQLWRHMQLGLGWKYYERDANEEGFDYYKNILLLTIEGSL